MILRCTCCNETYDGDDPEVCPCCANKMAKNYRHCEDRSTPSSPELSPSRSSEDSDLEAPGIAEYGQYLERFMTVQQRPTTPSDDASYAAPSRVEDEAVLGLGGMAHGIPTPSLAPIGERDALPNEYNLGRPTFTTALYTSGVTVTRQ